MEGTHSIAEFNEFVSVESVCTGAVSAAMVCSMQIQIDAHEQGLKIL